MDPSDPTKSSTSVNEILYRRLKNRERQRRYRERKRLRKDPSERKMTEQSSQLQIASLPVNVPVEEAVTRVYCKRDWKKDARRVHMINQEAMSNGLSSSEKSSAGAKQIPHFPLETLEPGQTVKSEVPSACLATSSGLSNYEKVNSKKRDWKAEARNKRT